MQTVKCGIKKAGDVGDLETKLFRFLATNRITSHIITGQVPAELLMNRRLRSRLDLFKPSVQNKVLRKQEAMIDNHKTTRNNSFRVGDPCLGELCWGTEVDGLGTLGVAGPGDLHSDIE